MSCRCVCLVVAVIVLRPSVRFVVVRPLSVRHIVRPVVHGDASGARCVVVRGAHCGARAAQARDIALASMSTSRQERDVQGILQASAIACEAGVATHAIGEARSDAREIAEGVLAEAMEYKYVMTYCRERPSVGGKNAVQIHWVWLPMRIDNRKQNTLPVVIFAT